MACAAGHAEQKLWHTTLTALVVGSMVGAGGFSRRRVCAKEGAR